MSFVEGFGGDAQSDPQEFESTQPSSNLDLLKDVELPLTVRFGSIRISLAEILGLGAGSVVEFERRLDQPVDLLINGRVVARGEAVMVQGNYGIRILEIASRSARLGTVSDMNQESIEGTM